MLPRTVFPERMDEPNLDPTEHRRALAGLRRINAWSLTTNYLWRAITHIASERSIRTIRILDVACGGGDLSVQIAERARRARIEVVMHGCDMSSTAVEHATALAAQRGFANCHYYVCNVFEQPFADEYDIVTSSLFLHHLSEPEAIAVLRKMSQAARHAVLVDDLVRSRFGYFLAQVGCRLLSRSPIVHYDGPVSVLGAFTLEEAKGLAAEAGLAGTTFTRHWPERYLMCWKRPQ
jgi:2-polyprenyl-3-methyl-5-hydroxy-6-metoxy-1,4-benzoquinol methylase